MTAAIGVSGAAILLILAASAQAQDPAGASPAAGDVTTQPVRDARGTTVGVQAPKVDPKLLIDVFKRLSRPRAAPKLPPPVSAPAPGPVAGAVATPTPVAPVVVAPAAPAPAVPQPAIAAPIAVPRAATPRPVVPTAKPPKPVEPVAASPVATTVAEPPSPPIAAPTEPSAPAPEPPVAVSQAPGMPAPTPAEPPGYFLAAGTLLPLIGLLAALAAIVAALSFSRARRIARTRAALALSPRLDLSRGGCSLGGLALAGPSVAIRARLDPPGARSG